MFLSLIESPEFSHALPRSAPAPRPDYALFGGDMLYFPQQLKGPDVYSKCSRFVGVHAAPIAATQDLFPFEPT